MNLEELVKDYIEIRTQREVILGDYEAKDQALKEALSNIEAEMLTICNSTNADSIKTQHGTVIRKLNERFYCNDWDNFRKFVLENEAVELLERRIHQGNFKEFMSERQDEGLPPGVNAMREFGIVVRKPASR
jgi:pyruvate dehydrogenase complex dehydrogenase (E1) component